MIKEAASHGLQIDQELRDHLVFGKPYLNSKQIYVPPNATADLHELHDVGVEVARMDSQAYKI